MPLSKAGKKIKARLEKQYGEKKGEGIFYAMENKGEIPGMKKKTGYNVGGQVPNKSNQTQARQMDALNRERAIMNARVTQRTPADPGSMLALSSPKSARQLQVGAMPTNQANKDNQIKAQKKALRAARALSSAMKSSDRPRAMNANQAGAMQAQLVAMAQAQKMAAARGPTQQGLQAPAGSKGQGFARQMSAAEAQKITRTRPRGFAEGGLTKSTGQMNTGIRKCGE